MTETKVVDASALAAALFGEPAGAAIAARLAGAALVARSLLGFELANVCLSKCRRPPDQADHLVEAFGLIGRMAVGEPAADHAAILRLAKQTNLTAYDASYLWLAQQFGAELVTLDRRLATGARAGGTAC